MLCWMVVGVVVAHLSLLAKMKSCLVNPADDFLPSCPDNFVCPSLHLTNRQETRTNNIERIMLGF